MRSLQKIIHTELFSLMLNHVPTAESKLAEPESYSFKCMLNAIALQHGKRLNYSELGRLSGLSYHTIDRRIRTLESKGFLRLLRSVEPIQNGAKSTIIYMIYIRYTDFLLRLFSIQSQEAFYKSPLKNRLLTGFLIDCSITGIPEEGCSFFYYRKAGARSIDLIIEKSQAKIGLLFVLKDMILPGDWTPLKAALKYGVISKGFIVYTGSRSFFAGRDILALSVLHFVDQCSLLLDENCPKEEVHTAIRRHNEKMVEIQREITAALHAPQSQG